MKQPIRGFSFAHVLSISIAISTMVCASAQADKKSPRESYVKGEYVVQLHAPTTAFGVRALERHLNAKVVDHVRPDMVVVRRDVAESLDGALKSLNTSPAVALAEPNAIYRAIRLPNDPDLTKLWGLKNTGGADTEGSRGISGVDISAERAWDITTGSKDVVVAVIDTGVDFTHPDLAPNAWVNQAEANGQPNVDDDGNGYVDDINGFNFVNDTGNVRDDNGHGSHCAGTIGGHGDDNHGVVGVNWNVSIMAVKFLDAGGSGTLANAIKAIDYTRKMGVKLSSNSWGGDINSDLLKNAIDQTREVGQLFLAAAGNEGRDADVRPSFPSGFQLEHIVSIAAVDNRGELAYFSNYGANKVHVAAPGVNVYSTVPGGYDSYSGTSMATPHVAGVTALLLANDSSMTYAQLKQRLIDTSRPMWTLRGRVKSAGMVDAYYALMNQAPPADPNDPANWQESVEQQVSSPHPYPEKADLTYTVKIDGAKRFSLHFSRFETEAGYDKLQFINSKGEVVGTWSGSRNDRYSPIIEGDTVTLKFTSDYSLQGYGFDIDSAKVER